MNAVTGAILAISIMVLGAGGLTVFMLWLMKYRNNKDHGVRDEDAKHA